MLSFKRAKQKTHRANSEMSQIKQDETIRLPKQYVTAAWRLDLITSVYTPQHEAPWVTPVAAHRTQTDHTKHYYNI